MDTILSVQNQNFSGGRGVYESFLSRRKSQKSFTLRIPQNLASPVKNCPGIIHCTSTGHRSETNGIAERAVRRVKEGVSAVLLQSGLDEKWWADSMERSCHLRDVQDLLANGTTQYEWRFGESFKGPIIPFGSSVILFLRKTSQGSINLVRLLNLEYSSDVHCLRGGIWKGDIFVADIEELESLDASEIHARRLDAKVQYNCLEELMGSENSPQCGIILHETKRIFMENRSGLSQLTK